MGDVFVITKLTPSKEMWRYYDSVSGNGNGSMTALGVASALADKLAGYHISYTATEVLKDLNLVYRNKKGNYKVNKAGKHILATYLHWKFHSGHWGVEIVDPTEHDNNPLLVESEA